MINSKKGLRITVALTLIVSMIIPLAACGSFKADTPDVDKEEVSLRMPQGLDEVISLNVPSDFNLEMEYPYGGGDGNPIVQMAYSNEKSGYFSAGIFSFKGWDCLGDTDSTVDLEDSLKYLDGMRRIEIDGESGYFGTCESDDMPAMVAVIYVEHGEYVFEFRLTNGDEQVTKAQIKEFEQMVSAVNFKN